MLLLALLLIWIPPPRSVHHTDAAVGFNGSFEHLADGGPDQAYPINWIVYAPWTVPGADFDLQTAAVGSAEGVRHLTFVVRACQSTGGWMSPGVATELRPAKAGAWIVRFAVRNQGARWRLRAGTVGALSGDMRVRMESDADTADWSYHEVRIERPWYRRTLRLEFNVVAPGTFELDDVSVRAGD